MLEARRRMEPAVTSALTPEKPPMLLRVASCCGVVVT